MREEEELKAFSLSLEFLSSVSADASGHMVAITHMYLLTLEQF